MAGLLPLPPFDAISNITSSRGSNTEYQVIVFVLAGILVCKIVYDLTAAVSNVFVKGYNKLTDIQKLEWRCRGVSTFYAIAISTVCINFLLLSDFFDEGSSKELITRRKSTISDTALGMSIGYFLSDMVIILWHFPAIGGMEYVLHHVVAIYAIFFSLSSTQALIYALLLLFTESTTPFVNLRWYLDVVGKKNSKLYIFNGLALFFGWMWRSFTSSIVFSSFKILINGWVARILLFVYYFNHLYSHFDEVKTLAPVVLVGSIMTPSIFSVLNLIWFFKIAKGTVKVLYKLRHSH